ncbi:hypothetical protein CEXT_139521 [Caerostris extrusa]|uniref:Uncharacterized protein n=1 Tax=Caerostris extrusa TaxID=172846 RepID=A0AAV4T8H8_CAEEX|nr:hypothetical protein CEXT_139521 [Caerostris extrusa]
MDGSCIPDKRTIKVCFGTNEIGSPETSISHSTIKEKKGKKKANEGLPRNSKNPGRKVNHSPGALIYQNDLPAHRQ